MIKTASLCKSCVYDMPCHGFPECNGDATHEPCKMHTSRAMIDAGYLKRRGVRRVTHCKCLSVAYNEECPYYKAKEKS